MNNTSFFQAIQYQYNTRTPVLQYNTETPVLVLQYHFGKQAILKQYHIAWKKLELFILALHHYK